MSIKTILAAGALATGLAGAANAAPAFNAPSGTETNASDSAVTPVYYGCYPIYRWVHTYYGWQQVYAGQRCPQTYGYYGHPHGSLRIGTPGFRLRLGF